MLDPEDELFFFGFGLRAKRSSKEGCDPDRLAGFFPSLEGGSRVIVVIFSLNILVLRGRPDFAGPRVLKRRFLLEAFSSSCLTVVHFFFR